MITYLAKRDYDKALDAGLSWEKKQPDNPVVYNLEGLALVGKKNLADARKKFERALSIKADYIPAARNLADLDLHDNDPKAARGRFEAILEKDKDNVQAMMALANLALRQNQEKEYVHWLKKVISTRPEALLPRVKLGDYYLSKQNKAKALSLAHDVVKDHPNSAQALELLGATQTAAGEKQGALATYQKLTEIAPDSAVSYLRLAMAQVSLKKLADARKSLVNALEISPGFLPAQDVLIRLDVAETKWKDALKIARSIQSQHPASPRGYVREGDVLMAQKQYAQAVKAYDEAMKKGGGSGELIKLHRAMNIAGDGKGADELLKSWIRQHPKDRIVRGYAAGYYMANHRDRDAIAQYQDLLGGAPNNAIILNNLALLYQRVGDERALPTAEKAKKMGSRQP